MVCAKCPLSACLYVQVHSLTSCPTMNKSGTYSSSSRRSPSGVRIPVFVTSSCGWALPRNNTRFRAISGERIWRFNKSAATVD